MAGSGALPEAIGLDSGRPAKKSGLLPKPPHGSSSTLRDLSCAAFFRRHGK